MLSHKHGSTSGYSHFHSHPHPHPHPHPHSARYQHRRTLTVLALVLIVFSIYWLFVSSPSSPESSVAVPHTVVVVPSWMVATSRGGDVNGDSDAMVGATPLPLPLPLPLCDEQAKHATLIANRWNHPATTANPHACTTFARNFPTMGGAGCPCPCDANSSEMSAGTTYSYMSHEWPRQLSSNMRRALTILEQYGPIRSADIGPDKNNLHVTMIYHCCIPSHQLITIKEVVDDWAWHDIHVRFGRVECAITGGVGGPTSVVSIILMLDEPSQEVLELETERIEGALRARGVTHTTHRRLQPHHMTLATLEGDKYPCARAIADVNRQIPQWLRSEYDTLILMRAKCNKCDTAAKSLRTTQTSESLALALAHALANKVP